MKYVFGVFLIGFLAGCSDNPVDFKSDEVEGKVTQEALEVFNKMDQSIYYFVVERGTSATILWAPISTEENEIKRFKSRAIKLKDIYGFEPGKEIQFNYWLGKGPEYSDIKNVIIQTD